MIVKIKNKHLYDLYLKAKKETKINNYYGFDEKIYFAHRFLEILDVSPDREVKAVVDAIFDGENVELYEQKYVVPLPYLTFDGNQIYIVKTSASKKIMIDWKPFSLGVQSEFTMDEIPEEYRKWAKKVED